jgi:hypothetical protein
MTTTEHDSYLSELGLPVEAFDPPLSAGERIIRAVLLGGFVVVLAVEAFLLWQAWRLMG